MGVQTLSFITGLLQGANARQAADRAAGDQAAVQEAQFQDWARKEQFKYDAQIAAASDPRHPDYWGIQNTRSLMANRLLSGDGGSGRAVMGIDGFVGKYVEDTQGLPVMGEDSWDTLMAGVASGLPYGEWQSGKDQWVSEQTRTGRALASAASEKGLDLGRSISGAKVELSSDRYGTDLSQLEFLDEAIEEFSPYVSFLMAPDPALAFDSYLADKGMVVGGDDYEEAMRKFEVGQAFWTSGFGGAFMESYGRSAVQAARQGLDRMARAQGILRGHAAAQDQARQTQKPAVSMADDAGPGPATGNEAREEALLVGEVETKDPEHQEWAAVSGREWDPGAEPQVDESMFTHPVMNLPTGTNEQVLQTQFQGVLQVLEVVNEEPLAVTPDMLRFLEQKVAEGYWPHLIQPALDRFRKRVEEYDGQRQMQLLREDLQRGRPRTHMLGGRN